MPPSAGACQTWAAALNPDWGRAPFWSSIMIAIGRWSAAASVTMSPVNGAGTRTGVGSGVGDGLGDGTGVGVGACVGVPLGSTATSVAPGLEGAAVPTPPASDARIDPPPMPTTRATTALAPRRTAFTPPASVLNRGIFTLTSLGGSSAAPGAE